MRPGQAAVGPAALRASFAAPLPASFYDRPATTVAVDLLGRWIIVRDGGTYRGGRIVETEAYGGRDPASHAYRGRTARNASMFGPPGTLYVYRIHQVVCANAVTRRGQAVLLRAAEAIGGGEENLSGPGRLCRGLGLTIEDDGSSLRSGRARLGRGDSIPPGVVAGPRVGISKATDRLHRFLWEGHAAVSSPRPGARRPAQRSFAQS